MAALAIALTTCVRKERAPLQEEAAVEIIDTTAAETNPATALNAGEASIPTGRAHKDGETITVSGTVATINFGKDGYTATVKDANGNLYSATISRVNLDDPKQYREVKAGDKVLVTGEVTNLEQDVLLRVKKFE